MKTRSWVSLLAMAVLVSMLGARLCGHAEETRTWDDAVELFRVALAAQAEARFLDAIELYEQALLIVRALKQQSAEAVILNNLGNCYWSLSDYARAIRYQEQALSLAQELGTRDTERYIHWSLGVAYRATDKLDLALFKTLLAQWLVTSHVWTLLTWIG